ncbi:MAG: DUF3352 domain-containing protein [Saprospiraceae bacterium]|nr:DUF3352 domain-containing protein [Saprospiraceae bacterium]
MIERTKQYIQERVLPILQEHRKSIGIGVGGFIFLFFLGAYLGFYRMPFSTISPFEAVPSNTVLVFETKEIEKTAVKLQETVYFKDLSSVVFMEKWEKDAHLIDSLCLATTSYSSFARQSHIVSALQKSKADDIEWLFVLKNRNKHFDINRFIDETGLLIEEKSSFQGAELYRLKNDKFSFAISYYKGLVLFSTASVIVEYGVVQLNNINSAVIYQKHFRTVQKTNGSGDLSIYINYSNLPSLGMTFINPAKNSLLSSNIFDHWSGLDAKFQEDNFVMSGHTYINKKSLFWSTLLKQKPAAEVKIQKVVPYNVAFMFHVGVEDYQQFYESYQKEKYEDFERYVLPWMGNEVGYMVLDPNSKDSLNFTSDKLLAIRTKDRDQAEQALLNYGKRFGILQEKEYLGGYTIRKLAGNDWALPILGEAFNDIQTPYYVVVEDFVIFANASNTIENWLVSYSKNDIIANNESFQKHVKQLKNKSNAYVLLNTPEAFRLILSYIHPTFWSSVKKRLESVQRISPIGIQFSSLKDHFLMTFLASWSSKQIVRKERQTSIAWTCDLQHEARIAPQIVRNHKTDANEIIVQDVEHILYLIDQSGTIIWDKALDEPILSKIYQIDFYNNGKLQYVFNTPSHIYMIDRKKNVFRKIELATPASAAMLVIDYGMGIRLFVPCANGDIYGFTKEGKPLAGWSPQNKTEAINLPIQFFQHKDKDYLLAANTSGKVYLFRRDGKFHTSPINIGGKISSIGVDAKLGRIAAGGTNGKIYISNLKGKRFGIGALKGMKKNGKFAYADVIGDERKDYIRLSNNRLSLTYYNDQQKIVTLPDHSFDQPQDEVFTIKLKGEAKSNIATVSKRMQQIFLMGGNGKMKKGFPFVGTSRYTVVDLFKQGKNCLIVANRHMIFAYKM